MNWYYTAETGNNKDGKTVFISKFLEPHVNIWSRNMGMNQDNEKREKRGEFKECHLEKQMTKYGGMDTF